MPSLSAVERSEILIHTIIWMDLKGMILTEKASLKGYILYDSICKTFAKRQKYVEREQIVIVRGWGSGVQQGYDYKVGSLRLIYILSLVVARLMC